MYIKPILLSYYKADREADLLALAGHIAADYLSLSQCLISYQEIMTTCFRMFFINFQCYAPCRQFVLFRGTSPHANILTCTVATEILKLAGNNLHVPTSPFEGFSTRVRLMLTKITSEYFCWRVN